MRFLTIVATAENGSFGEAAVVLRDSKFVQPSVWSVQVILEAIAPYRQVLSEIEHVTCCTTNQVVDLDIGDSIGAQLYQVTLLNVQYACSYEHKNHNDLAGQIWRCQGFQDLITSAMLTHQKLKSSGNVIHRDLSGAYASKMCSD